MDQENRDLLEQDFDDLKGYFRTSFRRMYDELVSELRMLPDRGMNGDLPLLEARKLNNLIVKDLQKRTKSAVAEGAVRNNCSRNRTETVWTNIQRAAPLPDVEPCRFEQVAMPPFSARPSADGELRRKRERQIEQSDANASRFKLAGFSGAAAACLALIIPGWSLPVKALLSVGIIVAGIGGSGAIYAAQKRNAEFSRFEKAGRKPQAADKNNDLDELLRKIADSQCEHHSRLFANWLDKVRNALIAECDRFASI